MPERRRWRSLLPAYARVKRLLEGAISKPYLLSAGLGKQCFTIFYLAGVPFSYTRHHVEVRRAFDPDVSAWFHRAWRN